jgi:hypothetical protein
MAIPNIPEFSTLLASLALKASRETTGLDVIELVPQAYAIDGTTVVAEDPIYLSYERGGPLTLEGLELKIQTELRRLKHKNDLSVVHAMLGIYCLNPMRERSPVDHLNQLLERTIEAKVKQFYVFPAPPPATFATFSFGTFTLGALNWSQLESRSRKVGSDYFVRYQAQLVGKMAVEREAAPSRILDLPAIRAELDVHSYDKVRWDRLIEYYFSSLSRAWFEEFWKAFESEQGMQVAAGAPFLGSREMQILPHATPISVFSAEDWGHVSPAVVGVVIDLVGADKRVAKILSMLKERYDFHVFSGTELHQTLKTFVQFVAKAKRHLSEGSLSDAGLHFVIALDLLLGDATRLTKTVSERTALIIHKQRGATFKECERSILAIYDARSKYVHRGEPISAKLVEEADAACAGVLHCLLRLQKTQLDTLSVSQWIRNLDFILGALVSCN